MPIFEYACKSCGHRYEKLSFGDGAASCPRCSGADVARQLSTFAVGGSGAGAARASFAQPGSAAPGGCGSCGDPRGPGSCSMN